MLVLIFPASHLARQKQMQSPESGLRELRNPQSVRKKDLMRKRKMQEFGFHSGFYLQASELLQNSDFAIAPSDYFYNSLQCIFLMNSFKTLCFCPFAPWCLCFQVAKASLS